jgi:hypothetical protein
MKRRHKLCYLLVYLAHSAPDVGFEQPTPVVVLVRLFDHLGTGSIELERTQVIEAPGVTHLTFRVVK